MSKTTLSLTTTAIATAMIAVLAQISLPIGTVPFTLLTVGVGLVASLLKPREAGLAGLLYLLLGAIGAPVFANFSGGFHVLVGATGGYLWGILVYLLVTSSLLQGKDKAPLYVFVANLLGDSLLFLLGFIGLQVFAKMDAGAAFKVGVLPFVVTDLVKLVMITGLSKPLAKALSGQRYFKEN